MSETYNTKAAKITVAPMTPRAAANAAKSVKKQGFIIVARDSSLDQDLAFQLALANAVLEDVTLHDGTGLNPAKRLEWLENTPGAIAFVITKSSEQGKALEAELELDEKNS